MNKYNVGDIADSEDGRSVVFNGQKWVPAQVADGPNGAVLINTGQGWFDPKNLRPPQIEAPQAAPTQAEAPQFSPVQSALTVTDRTPKFTTSKGAYNAQGQLIPSLPREDAPLRNMYTMPPQAAEKLIGLPINMIKNAPSSAGKFLSDMASAFLHPIDTAAGLGKTAMGYGQKLVDYEGEYVPYADALSGYFAQRYGGAENVVNTLGEDPVGFLGDLSTLFTGGAGLAKTGAFTAAKTGKLAHLGQIAGQTGRGASWAAKAVDPLSLMGKLLEKTKATKPLGALRDAVSLKLYTSALKPATSKYSTLADRITAMKTGIKERILPNSKGADKLNATLGALGDEAADLIKYQDRLEKSGVVPPNIDPNLIIQQALGRVEPFYQTGTSAAELRQVDKTLRGFQRMYGREPMPTAQAQQLKQALQKKVATSYGKTAEPKKEVEKALAFNLKEAVNKNVPKVGQLNDRMHNLYQLQEYLSPAIKRGENSNILSLVGSILGVGGGVHALSQGSWPTALTMAALTGGASLLSSPTNKARAAIFLDKMRKGPLYNKISPYIKSGLNVGRMYQASRPSLLDYFDEEK